MENSLREICAHYFLKQPPIIGGLRHIIEIDESLLVRKKYHVGHLVREQWVFGGYDNTDKVKFLVPIERLNKNTLLPIIEQYICIIRKYILICGGPMAEYNHFQKVIIIYKLIIQYI